MPQLIDSDIQTREVLDWKGVHLLHFMGSSCSQKTRIFLNLKGVAWESHEVNLMTGENWNEWFIGINPRGLVPVLVHDGAVIIESNDILTYIDQNFPGPKLIPAGQEAEIARLLKQEDDMHLDVRALTMRYVFGEEAANKDEATLDQLRNNGSGTVQGDPDPEKAVQIDFWQRMRKTGITDQWAGQAANNFRAIFDGFETTLGQQENLLGQDVTLVDIAWYIYVNRLKMAGYPFEKVHPNVEAWFQRLDARPEFAKECGTPPPLQAHIAELNAKEVASGTTLAAVAGF